MIIHKDTNLSYCEFVQEQGYDPTTTDWWKNKARTRREGILSIYAEMQKENPQAELVEAVLHHDRNISCWTTNEKQLFELGFSITNPSVLEDSQLRSGFDNCVEILYALGIFVAIENGLPMPIIFGKTLKEDTLVLSSGKRSVGLPMSNDAFSKFSVEVQRHILDCIYNAMTQDQVPDQVSCEVFEFPEENFIGVKAEKVGKFDEFIVVNIEKIVSSESATHLFNN